MKRLVVTAPGADVGGCTIAVEEDVPVPRPSSGEVLIRVSAAPVNPSDYGDWYRSAPDRYPLNMGKEGCGVVVAVGSFVAGLRCPVGTKVGFLATNPKVQGSYAEYVTANAFAGVFPMPDDLKVEDAASFFVNPYTAVGIIDTVRNKEGGGGSAFVHTAAASQLGQMIVKLAPEEGVEVINVVRREEQAAVLRELGAKHVVVTGGGGGNDEDEDEPEWKEDLRALVKELGATVAFDAVSGRMTGDLLDVLPPKGAVYTYGGLAGRCGNIDPIDLIYREKRLRGFFLTNWVKEGGPLSTIPRMMSAGAKVNAGLKAPGWSSSQFQDTTPERVQEDIVALLGGSATGKKLRIRFG